MTESVNIDRAPSAGANAFEFRINVSMWLNRYCRSLCDQVTCAISIEIATEHKFHEYWMSQSYRELWIKPNLDMEIQVKLFIVFLCLIYTFDLHLTHSGDRNWKKNHIEIHISLCGLTFHETRNLYIDLDFIFSLPFSLFLSSEVKIVWCSTIAH